jgi:integrase
MFRGVRYRVSCEELGAKVKTKDATLALANEWWSKKLAELAGPTDAEVEAEAGRRNWEVVWDAFGDGDPDKKPLFEKLFAPKVVPPAASVGTAIDEFLGILATKQKPKTYKEVQETLELVRGWWSHIETKELNEAHITSAWTAVSELAVSQGTKKKRWNFIKRFVNYLAETGRAELPRNVNSRLLVFKAETKRVETWSLEVVRSALAGLSEKYRLYALLGLNCGMTNVDIAELTKEMVRDGYLTRRRIKTGTNPNVPTVSYKLWPETLDLLKKFKSDHPTLWLTSTTGTKLVENRIEDGEVRMKDLIALNWKKYGKGCPIPPSKFRSVCATMLESHREFGRYVPHFLGHSPKTLKEKHYAAPSQEVFDQAMEWLHVQLFGERTSGGKEKRRRASDLDTSILSSDR